MICHFEKLGRTAGNKSPKMGPGISDYAKSEVIDKKVIESKGLSRNLVRRAPTSLEVGLHDPT